METFESRVAELEQQIEDIEQLLCVCRDIEVEADLKHSRSQLFDALAAEHEREAQRKQKRKVVAGHIIRQLGGYRFMSMVGFKNAVHTKDGVSFQIGKNSKKVNTVYVKLTPLDLYDVEFGWIRAGKYTVRSKFEMVSAYSLRPLFEAQTGMYTSL
jgi:hypothetical protein